MDFHFREALAGPRTIDSIRNQLHEELRKSISLDPTTFRCNIMMTVFENATKHIPKNGTAAQTHGPANRPIKLITFSAAATTSWGARTRNS